MTSLVQPVFLQPHCDTGSDKAAESLLKTRHNYYEFGHNAGGMMSHGFRYSFHWPSNIAWLGWTFYSYWIEQSPNVSAEWKCPGPDEVLQINCPHCYLICLTNQCKTAFSPLQIRYIKSLLHTRRDLLGECDAVQASLEAILTKTEGV